MISTEVPISRDSRKIDTPAASASVANVWRSSYGPRRSIPAASSAGSAQAIDDIVGELAETYSIREVAADPWHVVGLLSERWEQRGLVVVEWPQFDSRVVPATERLIRAVKEGRLTHPNDPKLNEHVEGSMLRDTRRGPRLDKRKGRNNDGLVALLMALDRVEHVPDEVKVLAWLG